VFALFHQVSVTLLELELEFDDVLLDPPLLHAASTVAAVAATATPRTTRFLCMLCHLPMGVAAGGRFRKF
jgi:hypothetical protein